MAAAAAASTASWRRSLRQATDQQVVQQQQPGFAQKEGGSTFGAAGATAVAGAGQGVLLAQAGATQLPQAQVQGQAQQQQQQQQQAQAAGLPRCAPAASRELFASRAGTGGTVMVAVMNSAQWDFGLNWLHHVKAAGIDFYVVAAADQATSERLAAASEPCFEWFDDEAPKLGLAWGQEGWRRMTWSKVFVLAAVVDYGFNLVVSDVDVVWFRDPRTLMAAHPDVGGPHLRPHGSSSSGVGDSGLELDFHPNHADFNTGVYTLRYSANISAWAHAWAAYFKDCDSHDQVCCYRLIRTPEGVGQLAPPSQRISTAWHGRIRLAVMPVSIFQSGHTRFVQKLHEARAPAKRVQPYVVHATWTYNGLGGKRARLRDMGLWVDGPEYYAVPSFVTVDLDNLQPPEEYNRWSENEDMVGLHLATMRRQLQRAYVGMALAVAAGRPFILPKASMGGFQCYCEKTWYGTVRCRIFDAQDFPLPVTCPTDYLFQPDNFLAAPESLGTPLDVREPFFLEHPRTPPEVRSSVLIILPSAALHCRDCVKEQKGLDGKTVLLVPPALRSGELLPLLEPYRHYRVWRLNFSGVGSTQRAYSGFSDQAAAEAFDRRMAAITTTWCCRRDEELGRYHKEGQTEVKLSMTPDFNFSSSFSAAGAAAASRTALEEAADAAAAGAAGAAGGGVEGGGIGGGGEGGTGVA
ncbi:hypothetical protein CHLNCDRAFT_144132 [Chlorella variabilis]|uniref:Nucleotide-diphospho-sugar transferase domain-containing protein n=1 Tax=Chlorella variabilis TaxID=554065 RepID=E1ZBZ4_CHLVA|nr:hypothetical protein CHLNCDRAFT_144132 [Chlorella variabilis]EFN56520.1 hypothetical protein CHLNCDRAFT_144132 [Chlorella variabilis]|eukprot:XP_005848622.1 hypothetical protein CHLNCDRAFT_144132 [Chlorella variabilis]